MATPRPRRIGRVGLLRADQAPGGGGPAQRRLPRLVQQRLVAGAGGGVGCALQAIGVIVKHALLAVAGPYSQQPPAPLLTGRQTPQCAAPPQHPRKPWWSGRAAAPAGAQKRRRLPPPPIENPGSSAARPAGRGQRRGPGKPAGMSGAAGCRALAAGRSVQPHSGAARCAAPHVVLVAVVPSPGGVGIPCHYRQPGAIGQRLRVATLPAGHGAGAGGGCLAPPRQAGHVEGVQVIQDGLVLACGMRGCWGRVGEGSEAPAEGRAGSTGHASCCKQAAGACRAHRCRTRRSAAGCRRAQAAPPSTTTCGRKAARHAPAASSCPARRRGCRRRSTPAAARRQPAPPGLAAAGGSAVERGVVGLHPRRPGPAGRPCSKWSASRTCRTAARLRPGHLPAHAAKRPLRTPPNHLPPSPMLLCTAGALGRAVGVGGAGPTRASSGRAQSR